MIKCFNGIVKKYSHTVGERREIDEVMSLILFAQRIVGHQILDPEWTWQRFVYKHIFTTFLFVYIIIGTFETLETVTDIRSKAEANYTIILTCIFPIKYLTFVNSKQTFQKLYVEAKTTLFDKIKEDSQENAEEVLKKCKTAVRLFFTMVLCPILMYFTTTMYYYAVGSRITLSATTSTMLPMTTPYYEIALIFHVLYLLNIIFSFIVIDLWYVLLMYFYCVASDSLLNMLNVEKRQGDTDEVYKEKLNDTLREFYTAHSRQMEYLNTLQMFFKWATAVPLFKVFVCTCLSLVVMNEGSDCVRPVQGRRCLLQRKDWFNQTDHSRWLYLPSGRYIVSELSSFSLKISFKRRPEFLSITSQMCVTAICAGFSIHLFQSYGFTVINIKFLSLMVPTFMEIFAYNWFGESIQTKAELLNMALLEFDWKNMRLKDKKNYFIIITYMNKEFKIKTIYGPYLSLITMTSVIKCSYQAYAVLRSMDE